MLVFFMWELLMLAILVALTLWVLAARGTPWHVYLSVWVSWGMALALVALVPIDLHIVYLKRCIDHYGDDVEAQEAACSVKSWRDIAGDNRSASEVLEKWLSVLRKAWIFVYTVCQVNGWILLTFQSSFIESRRFSKMGKFKQAFIENFGFYAALGIINSVGVLFIYMVGMDLEYVIFGCLALFNALMLTIVSLFLGYGLGEAPRALWQGSRFIPTIRRALYNVWANHRACTLAADDLAAKLVQVYSLRRAAGGAVRSYGQEIVHIMSEVPFDITSVFLMDPVKGPVLPSKKEDLQKAYVAQLRQIEMETTHKQKTTEVDMWLQALDSTGGMPRHSPLFSMQEKCFEAGYKDLGTMDQLDPALSKHSQGTREADPKVRQDEIVRQLQAIQLPGSANDHKSIALAIIKRNDATFLNPANEDHDPWANLEEDAFGGVGGEIKSADWDIDKLVALRTQVYMANRKYRKSKKKFDRSVKECILIQDLDRAHEDLLPWSCVWQNLRQAFVHEDRSETGWNGLRSPVRAQFEGPHAIRWEVAWFVGRTYVLPFVRQVLAIICCVGALAILQSQMAIFPGFPEKTGLLLLHLCSRGALKPNCIDEGQDVSSWTSWEPYKVLPGFQVNIGFHLFFICGIMTFVLLRLRIFSFYEIVIGETDSASLLLNAYIVCRLVPSLAHNYLAIVNESGTEKNERDVTAFESVFSSLGTIPFVNIDFNQVLPPLTLLVWLVTIINGLFKGKCKLPRLDGEQHKTQDIMDDAKLVVELERRRYEKGRAQSRAFASRQAHLLSASAEGLNGNGDHSSHSGVSGAWQKALNVVKNKTGIEMSPMGGVLNGKHGKSEEHKGLADNDACAHNAVAADDIEGQFQKIQVGSSVTHTISNHGNAGSVVTAQSEGVGHAAGSSAGKVGWSAMLQYSSDQAGSAFSSVTARAMAAHQNGAAHSGAGLTVSAPQNGGAGAASSTGAVAGGAGVASGGVQGKKSDWKNLMAEIDDI